VEAANNPAMVNNAGIHGARSAPDDPVLPLRKGIATIPVPAKLNIV